MLLLSSWESFLAVASDFNVLLARVVEGFADTDVDERTDSPFENLVKLRLLVIFF